MSTALVLLASALAAEATFFPNTGNATISMSELQHQLGMEVRADQAVLVHTSDLAALARLPQVARLEPLPGDPHLARLALRDDADVFQVSRQLHDMPQVRWAHPDLIIPKRRHTIPDDPGVSEQWYLQNLGEGDRIPYADIDAPGAWSISTGAGQRIAILDSGVDLRHPDLRVIPGIDVVDGDNDPSPDLNEAGAAHGTASAGVAAAIGNNGIGVAGVAYDAEVYAVRVIGSSDATSDTYTAFVDAVDAGATVLNNSWGFGSDCPETPRLGILNSAAAYAETEGRGGLGAAVVVSAGNGGCDFSNDGWQQIETLISVAASNARDVREPYSSYGSLLDITAPSGNVLTTDISGDGGYGRWNGDFDYYPDYSGTSAAAPMVSGTLALMFAANERLTAADARRVLCDTAVRIDPEGGDYDSTGWSPWYGCGRVDAASAVRAVANQAPLQPNIQGALGPILPGQRTVLTWDPVTDPDGDPITYEVDIFPDGKPRRGITFTTREPQLDITDELQGPLLVEWRVAAVDLWGRGPVSEPAVLALPEVPTTTGQTGCRTSGAEAPVALWLIVLCARPRRRTPDAPSRHIDRARGASS